MPFLILLLLAAAAGVGAALVAWRASSGRSGAGRAPALEAAERVGETAERHPALRAALDHRLDPEAATGLALTLALLFTAAAGTLLGVLASLVRTDAGLIAFDGDVARWSKRHATAFSTHAIRLVTELGVINVIIPLAVVVALVESWRTRNRWIVPFLVAVIGGEELLTTLTKQLVDRTRPTFFNPAAAALGPSFPSGHSANAAAFYAAAALLLGRRRGRVARAALGGAAVGIAIAVAASRVLLDVHWLSDVIGGLALGWAWFVICAIAFGGRVLRFGVAVEVAELAAEGGTAAPDGSLVAGAGGRKAR